MGVNSEGTGAGKTEGGCMYKIVGTGNKEQNRWDQGAEE